MSFHRHYCLLNAIGKGRVGLVGARSLRSSMNTNLIRKEASCWSKAEEYQLCSTRIFMSELHASAPDDDQQKKLDDSDLKDHVVKLHDYLVNFAIPKFFAIRHPWAIYNKDVYFENRLFDEVETAKGLDAYAWKLMKFRFGAILSYARSKLEVLGSRVEDKEITIHWRFSGLPQSTVFLAFWRFKPWKLKQAKMENSRVVEGISTLTVGSDKLIYKHVIDRLVLDRNMEESKSKNALLQKLQKIRALEAEKAMS